MKRKEIDNVLLARLADNMSISGDYPNVAGGETARPFFLVEFIAADRTGPMVNGDVVQEAGRMSVTIVVKADTNGEAASDYADEVNALFPQGLRLPIVSGSDTVGHINIQQPPDIRGGYRDGPDWRVPVIVKFTAISTIEVAP